MWNLKIKKKFMDFRIWLSRKIWYGKNPDETLAKRFKLFVLVGIALIVSSKLLFFAGATVPNIELIIPTLVVVGAFSLYAGRSERWSKFTRYFGILVLPAVFVIDTILSGLKMIYLFTWPGFAIAWYIGTRKDLNFMDDYKDITIGATISAAIAILVFDLFTAMGCWLIWSWRSLTLGSLYAVLIAQIPFTFWHLGSLIFIPPLAGLGKMMTRVKVKVPAATKASSKTKARRR